jgi:hypothetical protein
MARYSKNMAEQICALISTDSYTIAEICEKVNISERTYYDWKDKNAEFAELIKKARNKFDELIVSEAKKSLIKMIRGYTVQEKKTVTVDTGKKDENGKPIVKVKEHSVTDKHYQPVPAAVIFALTNRDPENWKNKQTNEVTGKDGTPLVPPISREMARKIIETL